MFADRCGLRKVTSGERKANALPPDCRNIAISLIGPLRFDCSYPDPTPVARNLSAVITYLIVPDIWKGSRVYLCLRALVPVMLA
jgi:hypothetical protein